MEKENKNTNHVSEAVLAGVAFGLAFFRFDVLFAALLVYAFVVVKNSWLNKQCVGALGFMLIFKAVSYLVSLLFEGIDLLLGLFKDSIDYNVFTTLDSIEKFVVYGVTVFFIYKVIVCIKQVLKKKDAEVPFLKKFLS